MFVRIVKMGFHEKHVVTFLEIFESKKQKIRSNNDDIITARPTRLSMLISNNPIIIPAAWLNNTLTIVSVN